MSGAIIFPLATQAAPTLFPGLPDVCCAGQAGATAPALEAGVGLLRRGPVRQGLMGLPLEQFELAQPDDVAYLILQTPLIASHTMNYLDPSGDMK